MEFLCVFLLFPLISVLSGVLELFVFKRIVVIGVINLAQWMVLTFTVFNSSFWIWAVNYTLLAMCSAYFVKRKFRRK